MPLESRYDQVRCCNDDSEEAWGEVEATHVCPLFELLTYAKDETNDQRQATASTQP